MADNRGQDLQQNQEDGYINKTSNSFVKGLNKDIVNYLSSPDSWVSAKNMQINTLRGDVATLSTEPANQFCVKFPYTLIGAIALDGAQWCVFCTDNVNSEIGIVDVDNCTYTKFSNTPCLNFNTANLITGASRRNYDCGFNIYWSDGGRNPDRYINTNTTDPNNNIWIQNCTTTAGCTTCVNTDQLNCDNIRIAPIMQIPTLQLDKGAQAGTLPNGMYQVALAYAQNGIKCTDYVILSNPQGIFSHNNIAGCVVLTITGADQIHFKQMILTVISYNNGQLVAKKLGTFDTTESKIVIDKIDPTLPTEDLALIPLQNTAIESSDSIWNVNTYLLRNGVREKPDFNYQPLANQITTSWSLVQYPEKYYQGTARNPTSGSSGIFSGNNYSYLQDEVYCFFIRWVYNTGDKSASYHIPGRVFNGILGHSDALWATQNTGLVTSSAPSSLPDGGTIVLTGQMAYWESTELYPSEQPAVWNANIAGHPEWDLCGQPIRHHKFPDQTVDPRITHFNNGSIYIMGVQFGNIQPPIDINGNPITNIVGYEILRGSREGNKSIVAKGMINNMWTYTVPGTGSGGSAAEYGLFQNFPANDLRDNYYLTWQENNVNLGGINGNPDPLKSAEHLKRDVFSFHSPDTTFQHPYLGSPNLKVYQELQGTQNGRFTEPYKHPLFKVTTNLDSVIADIVAAAVVIRNITAVVTAAFGGEPPQDVFASTESLPMSIPLYVSPVPDQQIDGTTDPLITAANVVIGVANIAMAVAMAVIEFKVISQQLLNIIAGVIPGVQYARQFNGHSWYNTYRYIGNSVGNRIVNDYQYVGGNIQTFANYEVNNLYRNDYVALQLNGEISDPALQDLTRYTLTQSPANRNEGNFITPTSAYYAGIKLNVPSQYGQIGSVRELVITNNVTPKTNTATSLLFGGDTYVNRYTEKNPFMFFNDWLIDVQEDYSYNYRNYINVPYPGYWLDNTKVYALTLALSSNNRRLDNHNVTWFYVSSGYFYLFCNGVRDFYVESDVNVGFRDWGDPIAERFYDPYGFTDLAYMFRSDIIKSNQYYKYDYSLSVSKFFTQYTSFGQTLDITYDPNLAYTCYDYYPRRIIYSLPQTEELKADNWRQFLPNNFYDFYTQVTAVKSISKTGALFMMKEQSPIKFEGVQVLQQGEVGKTAITIGDGGLFNQPLQNVINTDKGIGYGNSISRWSTISTPHGVFYVSQQAGKVFQYTNTIEEISAQGLKWWFAKYLPSQLLIQFPDYPLYDNPVVGIGTQCSYDETMNLLYISKKDYKLKPEWIGKVILVGNDFVVSTIPFITDFAASETGTVPPIRITKEIITLGDPRYFTDCSFTISYSCTNKFWVSYHSWNPELSITGRVHNLTSKISELWKHNNRTDLYSNFYSVDYPTNIEFNVNTKGVTETLKNVNYFLDTYFYQPNGYDRFLQYDVNFDNAIIYNTEQCTPLLNLTPKPNNPYDELQYPIVNPSSLDVLYSVKERLYRFGVPGDYTKNRGEYIPTLTQAIITSDNGVDWTINPLYIDMAKPTTQIKKLRGYSHRVFLSKSNVGANQLNFRQTSMNEQISKR